MNPSYQEKQFVRTVHINNSNANFKSFSTTTVLNCNYFQYWLTSLFFIIIIYSIVEWQIVKIIDKCTMFVNKSINYNIVFNNTYTD